MKMLGVAVCFAIGCTGGGRGGPLAEICGDGIDNDGDGVVDDGCDDPPNLPLVSDLGTNEQVDLCNEFVAQVCANTMDPTLDAFCADACLQDPQSCTTASETLAIDTECDLVNVDDVEECFLTGDLDTCSQGGGCMFDALESVCAAL